MDGDTIMALIKGGGGSGVVGVILYFVFKAWMETHKKKTDEQDESVKAEVQSHIKAIQAKNDEIARLQEEAVKERGRKRDEQYKALQDAVREDKILIQNHLEEHKHFESSIYQRLNPIAESVAAISATINGHDKTLTRIDANMDKLMHLMLDGKKGTR